MDITQLRSFLKTVETMNFTRAAEGLFISRQALRQSLSALERELGQPLFENDRNRLSLTRYGEYLALACAGAVREFDALEESVGQFFHKKTRLRFAYSVSLTPYILPGLEQFALPEFSRRFPQVELEILPCTSDEVIDMVERREVDCGCVLQLPVPHPGCTAMVLRTIPVTIASGRPSPYFGRESFTLEELAPIPLIGMGSLEKIAKPLWEECERRGLRLDYHSVPDAIDALYQMRHGICSCFSGLAPQWRRSKGWEAVQSHAVLEGYTWELALLCPSDSPNFHSARLLCSFLAELRERGAAALKTE